MNSKSIEKNEKLKQGFENLKSNFIFKKIFNIMRKNRTLEIVKYNKILQKRLNLSIRDYKAYYSSIEIELKLLIINMVNSLIYSKKKKNIFILMI